MASSKRGTKRQILSYVLDWLLILLIAGLGGLLYSIRGNSHAFSLTDPTISYPLYPDTVSITVVGLVALVVPAVFTAILSILPTTLFSPHAPSLPLRLRLWSWHTAWLGLALSCASAFFVTSALKTTVGKPRPNLLARCDPDTSTPAIAQYAVGGLGNNGTNALQGAPILVTMGICRNPNKAVVLDGFAAWPSGHSSFAFAGLIYFSLWLCGRLAVAVPDGVATRRNFIGDGEQGRESRDGKNTAGGSYGYNNYTHSAWRPDGSKSLSLRTQVAAPPLFLLLLSLIPAGGALYICGSRWADNQHAGWDILAGAFVGGLFAWLGFRWYHPPIQNLMGVSWGPRSRSASFFGRVDVMGGSESEERLWRHERLRQNENENQNGDGDGDDVELGAV